MEQTSGIRQISQSETEDNGCSRGTVLVVDDEPRIVNFLRVKLSSAGYRVLTAGNGSQALETIREAKPDLMVLDVVMPDVDGFEVLRQVRASSTLPIIIVTAKTGGKVAETSKNLGASDYLEKPFQPEVLVSKITALLSKVA